MPSRSITLLVRATGARTAARDLNLVSRAASNVGRSSHRANRQAGALSDTLGTFKSAGKMAALGIGLAGAEIVRSGLKFNAMMEQQKIAFTSFLGSTGAATSYLDRLYQLAAVTPFEFPELVKGTRTMMAYGMASEDTYRTMKLLGDAIASAPTEDTANQIARTARALGQITAAGVLHAQDLNQLVDAGVTSVPKLAKEMGLSTKQFRKQMSLGAMDSERFFKAQRALWEKDPIYSGMAEKQSKTFYGQMATLHDLSVQTFGAMTLGIFEPMTNKILPAMIQLMQELNTTWIDKTLTLEEKFGITRDTVDKIMEPLLKDFERWWKREEVSERLSRAFAGAIVRSSMAFKDTAWYMAKTWFAAFKEGSNEQKLSMVSVLLMFGLSRKLIFGAGGLLKKWLFGGFAKGKGKGVGGAATGVMNVKAGVVNVYGPGAGLPGDPLDPKNPKNKKKPPGRLARVLSKMRGPAKVAAGVGTALLGWEGVAAATLAYGSYLGGKKVLGHAQRYSRAHPFGGGDPMGPHNPGVNPMQRITDRYAGPGGNWGWKRKGGLYQTPQSEYTTGSMQQTLGHLATGGYAHRSGMYTVGERGRENVHLPKGASVSPQQPITVNLNVDGRTLATVVHREGVKARSTR